MLIILIPAIILVALIVTILIIGIGWWEDIDGKGE
jgi:hypothetical protein